MWQFMVTQPWTADRSVLQHVPVIHKVQANLRKEVTRLGLLVTLCAVA